MVAALVLTGAPGAGKTTALLELGTRLEIEGVPYGAIESEQLTMGSPVLSNEELLPQLAAVLQLQREAGRRLFLIVATIESEADLRGVVDAARADKALVVCLRASPDTVAARIETREPDSWPSKGALIDHARDLADTVPEIDGIDLVIDTDAEDRDAVVDQTLDALRAHALLPQAT
jgi:hypothetical protein